MRREQKGMEGLGILRERERERRETSESGKANREMASAVGLSW